MSITVEGITRELRLSPSECGPNAMFFARLGDLTWDTVGLLCDTDVLDAVSARGKPAYLSFYYYRVRGSAQMHPYRLTFGDRLSITSGSFNFGTETVLTVHRVSYADRGPGESSAIGLREFYEEPRDDRLYVEILNRWVSRGDQLSNRGLVAASPASFRNNRLPSLPDQYSPRRACAQARRSESFHPDGIPGYRPVVSDHHMSRDVDPSRDLNAVGLIHYASFFSFVDGALWSLWSRIGRTPRDFMARRMLDIRVAYFGNANSDATLRIRGRLWRSIADESDEIAEFAIHDAEDSRLLAVAAIQTQTAPARRELEVVTAAGEPMLAG